MKLSISTFIFILLLAVISSGQILDSLVNKGRIATKRNLHGFMFNKTNRAADIIVPKYEKSSAKSIADFEDNETKIENLEISVAKLTVICENLQKQSDSHSDNQDLFLKLIEALGSGLIAIIIAIISKKLKLQTKGD